MATAPGRVELDASNGAIYQGQVTGTDGEQMTALRSGSSGSQIQLAIQLQVGGANRVTGTVQGRQA